MKSKRAIRAVRRGTRRLQAMQRAVSDTTALAHDAATVIGRRVAMGQAALLDPARADHAEAARMIAEKMAAAGAAGAAALTHLPTVALRCAAFTSREATASLGGLHGAFSGASPAAAVATQIELAGAAAVRIAEFWLAMGDQALALTSAMMAPASRTARDNARRLGRGTVRSGR
ncbi:MAG: hypothetical protein AB7P02_07530 [Alphaproteobacteria bacterium]